MKSISSLLLLDIKPNGIAYVWNTLTGRVLTVPAHALEIQYPETDELWIGMEILTWYGSQVEDAIIRKFNLDNTITVDVYDAREVFLGRREITRGLIYDC